MIVKLDPHNVAVYRRLWRYATPYWVIGSAAIVAMATAAGVEATLIILLKPLTDQTLVEHNLETARWMPWAFIGIFIVRGLAGYTSEYSLGWIGRGVISSLRRDVFQKFLTLPTRFFEMQATGPLLARMTYNVEMVAEASANVVTVMVRDLLTVVACIGVMLWHSIRLTAFVAIVVPLIAITVRVLSGAFRRYSGRIQDSIGDVTRVSEEVLMGNRIVKVFGGHEYERNRIAEADGKNRKQNMKLINARALGVAVTQVLFAFGIAGVIYVAGKEAAMGSLSPGTFISFIGAMILMLQPLRRLTTLNASLQRGITAADSLFSIMDEPDEVDSGTFRKDRVDGTVEFKNVNFSYGGRNAPVLRDLSVRIEAGSSLAIVGHSGSGKSTLVSLLPRFYDVESGTILLDDRPVEEYTLENLRDNISLVTQDVVLFNDTIANNLAYGQLRQCSRADLLRAAEAAHVIDFIKEMPEGLETMVGDRGVLLSGGQRQRIAIGRALLKDAPVLILDEATSSLDTKSERHIQDALKHLMKNRTTLVIAHRLSTVEGADRIIVLDKGSIVESGTHRELIAHDGLYADLYRMQFSDEQNGDS
ncbi:MAG: lipid A export permease/ATP-binding protein MsbA [Proteobacteria bacterium]|nr:lipid A export permease/ATP-binding protein MsbA [Pseudomonadota bacterium]